MLEVYRNFKGGKFGELAGQAGSLWEAREMAQGLNQQARAQGKRRVRFYVKDRGRRLRWTLEADGEGVSRAAL